jgi:F-type H+-transporting ATPase subunit b
MNITFTIVAQGVAFALFIWFTVKFVWPPMLRAIETRQKQIADGLAAGERGRQELESATRRADESIKQARERSAEIIAQAEKRVAQMIEEAKTTAKTEGERLVSGAKAEIEQEVSRARESLRDQVAALAVAGAEKILRREINAGAHADMLAQLKKEI